LDYFEGQTASLSRKVTEAEVEAFAWATGDANPVHLDEDYAKGTRFKQRIAHGMLVGSYISALLGTQFPGPGTIYMSQSMSFLRPVFLEDTVNVVATVTGYRPDREILTLRTECFNQRGDKVVTGEAVCLVSDVTPAVPILLHRNGVAGTNGRVARAVGEESNRALT
jgi:3-hydroxybutyryl-CoA dehydratase